MAMALQAPFVPENKTFAFNTSLGFFDGENAIASSGAIRLTNEVQIDGGVSFGLGGDSAVGGRAGVTFAW